MQGEFGQLAAVGFSSNLVEASYGAVNMKTKEIITAELYSHRSALERSHQGNLVLRRCGVNAYKENADAWRKHETTKQKTMVC